MSNAPFFLGLGACIWCYLALRRAAFGRLRSFVVGVSFGFGALLGGVLIYVTALQPDDVDFGGIFFAFLFVFLLAGLVVNIQRGCAHRALELAFGRPVYGVFHHAKAAADQLHEHHLRLRKARTLASSAPQHVPTASYAPGKVADISFTYRKPDGTERRRTVRVERHGFDGSSKFIEGICIDAGATRSFRLDRIQGEVTDLGTGELLTPADLYRKLGSPARALEAIDFARQARANGRARRPGWQTAVFFAGFSDKRRVELEILAEAAGWDVRYSIGSSVDYMVTGGMAGRRQIEQADQHGVTIINEDAFRGMV